MAASREIVATSPTVSPLEAFSGPIPRTKVRPIYSIGLGIVAFAMVLLPLIYIALILFTAWAVLFHLKNDTWIFEGASGGMLIRLVFYLGPVVAGGILLFFMVKPFFAAKAKAPAPVALDPAKEPLLFEFVKRISGLVGAPAPCRIDLDCQVNASASLQRGFWSNDLVLTIGLPLVTGLDMHQFAGVLAHEFGHFAQGAGMRLTHVIRKINFWFARVVYERDEWDLKLERSARSTDVRIGVMLHLGRGCVWLTRRILWALMHAGHAISCFMLRQMEYDADSYEAKIAGSDAFASTASRLRVMNVAAQSAYEDLRRSWASNRLPDNLPLLIQHKANSLPAEVHRKLSDAVASRKTRWFDTHPCDADRIQMVQQLDQPGVFRLTEPATGLFSDFPELSRSVTRHQYEKQFSLQVKEQNLMSAEEILSESLANTESDALVRKYFGTINVSLSPLLTATAAPAPAGDKSAIEQWRETKQATETLHPEAEKTSAECVLQQRRLVTLTSAHRLAKAGFKLRPKEFGLPETATSAGEQETAARFALEETTAAISEKLAKLEPFVTALRRRISIALQITGGQEGGLTGEGTGTDAELRCLLRAVGAEMPRAHEIGSKLSAFKLLAQNRANHPRPSDVDRAVLELVSELKSLLAGIQTRLKPFAYPFPHARGRISVADYARSEQPAQNDWQRVYQDSQSHVERLFALNYRLIGRVLAQVDAAEKSLGDMAMAASKQAGDLLKSS